MSNRGSINFAFQGTEEEVELVTFMKSLPPHPEVIAELKAHALEHYNDGGWDVVVECYEDSQIAEVIGDAKTLRDAIKAFEPLVDAWSDRQADAEFHRTESYCGFQGIRDWCYYPPGHEGDTHSDGTPVSMTNEEAWNARLDRR